MTLWRRLRRALFDRLLAGRVLPAIVWNDRLTERLFGVRVHDKVLGITWDLTSLCLKKALDEHAPPGAFRFLDLGCGQLALLGQYVKRRRPDAEVVAVYVYPEFVANARANAARNRLAIDCRQGDLFDGLDGFDLIAFNPPLEPDEPRDRHRFRRARYAGADGTALVARFLEAAPRHLTPGGRILLGMTGAAVARGKLLTLARSAGFEALATVKQPWSDALVLVLGR